MAGRTKSSKLHPLVEAAKAKQFSLVLQLLRDNSSKLEPAVIDECFVRCVLSKDLKLLDECLSRGASIDARWNGYTALSTVSGFGDAKFVKSLLKRGANPNAAGVLGATPLIACARVGIDWEDEEIRRHSLSVGRTLLKAGASVNSADESGNTALDYAFESRWPPMAQLLFSQGASLTKCSNDGAMVLFWAVTQPGSTQLLDLYLKYKGPTDLEIAPGVTALAHAKKAGWSDKVKLLEKAGRR